MVHTLAGMFQNVLSLNYLIQCLRKCSRMFYTYELSVIQICAVTVYSFVYLRNFVHNAQLECSTIFFLTYTYKLLNGNMNLLIVGICPFQIKKLLLTFLLTFLW